MIAKYPSFKNLYENRSQSKLRLRLLMGTCPYEDLIPIRLYSLVEIIKNKYIKIPSVFSL